MHIEVIQEDIDEGVAHDCHTCPVARAIARAYGIEQFVSGKILASPISIVVRRNGQYHSAFRTPLSVRIFILRFDQGLPVSPFAFELPDIPDAAANLPDEETD